LVFTELMPFSIAVVDEYISLRPIICPLAALSTKYGWLLLEVSRS